MADAFVPGARLAGRYRVIKLLGRGGMGAVYHAWDDALSIPVAIKTILPRLATDGYDAEVQAHRFKRELLLARQVSHKNVVRIHDLGEVGATKYITMAYVEGETLAARMRRIGPMPVPEALALVRQVAAGLAAAHDAGIVHRDLKPENIMVTPEDVAIVMDFGIAQPVDPTSITSGGAIVGTIEYMAPEQAKGEPVDARTDVYALGLVLYDMLVGRRRVRPGASPVSELLARATTAPPSPRSLGAPVPEATEAVVMCCLQTDAAARYPTAAHLAAALDDLTPEGWGCTSPAAPANLPSSARRRGWAWAAGGLVAVLAAAGAGRWVGERPLNSTSSGPREPMSVLVADFVNAVGDPTFDGLVEQALGVGLEGSSFITAFPRRDALRAAAQLPGKALNDQNARLVAMREGIQIVVTGRLESYGQGYRLVARAVTPGPNERTLHESTTIARGKDEVLPIVGRAAARLRNALGDATVNPEVVRPADTFTAASLDAARAYVEGQELLAEGRQGDALAAYQRAVDADPSFGRAWAGQGAVLNNLGRIEEARDAYKRALARVDFMTEREVMRTRAAYYVVTRNAQMAWEESQALVKRFPADAAGLANLANAHFQRREFDQAIEVGRRAAAIFPNNVLRRNNVALFSLYAGRFDVAEAEAARTLELNADYPRARLALGLSQVARGELDRARETFTGLATVAGGRAFAAHGLADLALYRGRVAEAVAALEPAIASETSAAVKARLSIVLAEALGAQGNTAAALRVLQAVGPLADTATRFAAGRLLVALGRSADAGALADQLTGGLDPDTQALGAVLEAEIVLAAGDARGALARLGAARALTDSWWLRFAQGRAHLAAGRYAEADSEFDACFRRSGEAAAAFLDDLPTWRLIAPLHYYRGLAREGLGSPGAGESFRAFLALKAGGDESGGLVADARKRTSPR